MLACTKVVIFQKLHLSNNQTNGAADPAGKSHGCSTETQTALIMYNNCTTSGKPQFADSNHCNYLLLSFSLDAESMILTGTQSKTSHKMSIGIF